MKTSFKLSRPDGTPITNWQMWTQPKRSYQWKPERSAMELAKAWFQKSNISPPEEITQLLNSSDRLKGLSLLRGIPEHVTSLPERGGGRNHDLWIQGKTNQEQVTICIEAKADEPFGNETVAEYRASALKRRESGKTTRVPERIDQLLALVPDRNDGWDGIRYQLLAAICGTAIQAKRDGSPLAVFVVHEFHTHKTTPAHIGTNAKYFDEFMAVIGASQTPIAAGMLFGPVIVAGVDCLIGKAVR